PPGPARFPTPAAFIVDPVRGDDCRKSSRLAGVRSSEEAQPRDRFLFHVAEPTGSTRAGDSVEPEGTPTRPALPLHAAWFGRGLAGGAYLRTRNRRIVTPSDCVLLTGSRSIL